MCGVAIILGTKESVITSVSRRARGHNFTIFAYTSGAEAVTSYLLRDIAL